MKAVRTYVFDATNAIKDGRIEHAVWCMENAYSISSENEKKYLELTSSLISEDNFIVALESVRKTVRRVQAMLDYQATLSKEEWILILTELSTAYAFTRFNERRNWKHKLPELSDLMESLRLATDSFTNPDIRSQLKGMRRYNPNPLPSPL